jgi:hypothetical protein
VKTHEVPQDPGACLAGHEKLNYAVDAEGKYVGVPTIGWEVENTVTQLSTQITADHITRAWEDARAGRTSPLGYHMAVVQMDAGQLAAELGIWAWQVRRHVKPAVFAGLSAAKLGRYADALGITVEALRQVPDAPDLP